MTIVSVGASGDGIGRASDGSRLFVPCALPGEDVLATVLTSRGGGMAARLERIDTASPDRIPPACPHFGACGGCALQHWAAAPYLAWKADQLRDALIRAGFADPPVARTVPVAPGTRRRMHLALRRAGPAIALGLHRARGSDVIDLGACPVLDPALFALLAPLRALARGLTALRRAGSVIANLVDTGADVLLRTDAELTLPDRQRLAAFAHATDIARLSWARDDTAPEPVAARRPPVLTLSGVPVRPPPGAFLQASAAGEAAILAAIMAPLPALTGSVIELHAGIGTLTFALARTARVAAFEADASAVAALRAAAGQAGLAGRITATIRDLAYQPLSRAELARADAVVLDPPEAGAAAQMPALAEAAPPMVVYVSCNPATLARDAALLARAGYAVDSATPIDQFVWSARVESVTVFRHPHRTRARADRGRA